MADLTVNEVRRSSPVGIWGNDSCVQCGACCYDYRVNGPQKSPCPNQTFVDGKSYCAMHDGPREQLCREFVCRDLQPESPLYERNCQKWRAIAQKLGTVPSADSIAQSHTCRTVTDPFELRERQLALHTIITDDCMMPYKSPGFALYTGLKDTAFGEGIFENTCLALQQMAMALALRKHPVIEDLIHNYSHANRFDARPLAEARVLAGLRILDIGCGHLPTFARCARALGAEVYTADSHLAWQLYPREHEKDTYHIHVPDLNQPDSVQVLLDRTGGEFDFVTAAGVVPLHDDSEYLRPPSIENLAAIGRALLKDSGVYYHDWGGNYKIFMKPHLAAQA